MSRALGSAAVLIALLTVVLASAASATKVVDGSFGSAPKGLTLTREMQVVVASGVTVDYGFTSSPDIPGEHATLVGSANTLIDVVSTPGYYWMLDGAANVIRRVSVADYTMVPFTIPTSASGARALAVGPDGNIWFTEHDTSKIGRLLSYAPNTFTEFPLTNGDHPTAITSGDRTDELWVVEEDAHKLGRVRLSVPGDVSGDGSVSVADVFYLINFLFAGGPAPR